MIPIFRPSYDEREIEALRETLNSGWVGLGPKTKLFEEKFAEFIGTRYAVALNSATAALHLSLLCLEVKGSEVISIPLTFISVNHAILYSGAAPVFCDVEPDTMNIDASKIEPLITPRTKAVICVHYGGRSCDMERILKICEKHNLALIEDCSHAAGGKYKSAMLGSLGKTGCFSFQAVKNLAAGDGGMVTTDRKDYYERLKRLRWLGITKDTFTRGMTEYSWYYDVAEVGYKYHMNDIAAAIGLVQLEKLEAANGRRRQISAIYDSRLAGVGDIELLSHREYQSSAAHNYVIKTGRRDALNDFLREKGVSTGVHYYPNHLYDIYKPYYRACPVAEAEWSKLLTLPLFPALSNDEVDYIIRCCKDFFSKNFI